MSSAERGRTDVDFDRILFAASAVTLIALIIVAAWPADESQREVVTATDSVNSLLQQPTTRENCLRLFRQPDASPDVLSAALHRLAKLRGRSRGEVLAEITVRIDAADSLAARNCLAMWLDLVKFHPELRNDLEDLSRCGLRPAEDIGWAAKAAFEHDLATTMTLATDVGKCRILLDGLCLLERKHLPPEVYRSLRPFVRNTNKDLQTQCAAIHAAGVLPFDQRTKAADFVDLILDADRAAKEHAITAMNRLPAEFIPTARRSRLLAKLLSYLAWDSQAERFADVQPVAELCRRIIDTLPESQQARPRKRLAELTEDRSSEKSDSP